MNLRTIAVLLYLSVSLFVPCGRSTAQETKDPSPKEITVSPTDDIDAINANIEKLEDGGTLIFSPGQYHFNKSLVIKNKSITLRGSDITKKDEVVLTSDTQKTISIVGNLREDKGYCKITIEGITVRNDYQPEKHFVEYVRRSVVKPREWLCSAFFTPKPSDDPFWIAPPEDTQPKEQPRFCPSVNCAIKQCCGYLDVISCELSVPQGIAVNVIDHFPEEELKGLPFLWEVIPYVVDTCVTDCTICDSFTAVKTSRPVSLRDSIISNNEEGIALRARSRGNIDNVQFTGNNIALSADDFSAAAVNSCAFLGNNTAVSSQGENCSLQVNQSRFKNNKTDDVSCLAGTLFALSCTHSGGEGNAYNCLSPNVFLSDTSIEGYPVGINCSILSDTSEDGFPVGIASLSRGACRARNVTIRHCKTAIRCFGALPLLIQDSSIADCEQGVSYETEYKRSVPPFEKIKRFDGTPLFGRYERNRFTDTSAPWNIPSGPSPVDSVSRRDNEPNQ